MSRFLAIRRFLDGEIGTFEEMADKVENLNLDSAMKIQEDYSPRLHRILRGERITPDHDDWLKTRFDVHEYRIITDFNRAARYVRRLDRTKPEFRRLILPGTLEDTFHLPVKPGCYNKVLMSLVLSYIFNPAETLREVRRIIEPGGLLVLSSMRPDTDASGPFTRLLEKIEAMPEDALPSRNAEIPPSGLPPVVPQRRPGAVGARRGGDVRFLRPGKARCPAGRGRLGQPEKDPHLRRPAARLRRRGQTEERP